MAKILVVDGDKGVTGLLTTYFTEKEHDVTVAQTAETALEILRKADPQFPVVITGNRLMMMQGPKLIKEVQKLYPEIKIIFMSGSWYGPLPKGVYRFFEKPFDADEMGCAVECAVQE